MSTNDTLDVDDGDISIFHLRRAVVNEMNSPELLTYEQDVMDHFLTLLKEVRPPRSPRRLSDPIY